ncbi:putative pilin [Candidatus Mycosynbacter amalyticus]|uniref:Pilin n=1 Tax=Candidatus Mycosynbacter amalyticus TaxID=2665156 RepID=A0A857MMC5_9BACT|nr:type II secretion system protein [Candidatus Mycosynbacter amalyticus]QHN42429.1 putative pilin [Candidatus Mycosynbacter amalyticus]
MNNTNKQQGEGFTIIEVVLVLAIAALILLMVFLALPALQRNQRDTTRKNDVSRLQSAINNYKSRNRGALPTNYTTFFESDLRRNNDLFDDPSAGPYTADVIASGTFSAGTGQEEYDDSTAAKIYIYRGLTCKGEDAVGTINPSARKVAIVKPLEGGGRHCAEA